MARGHLLVRPAQELPGRVCDALQRKPHGKLAVRDDPRPRSGRAARVQVRTGHEQLPGGVLQELQAQQQEEEDAVGDFLRGGRLARAQQAQVQPAAAAAA